jgi:signal transduction histidine kinase
MNRLAVRFTLSHLLVAVVGGLVTFAVVWALAPAMFDSQMHGAGQAGLGQGPGSVGGAGYGQALRASFAAAITNSLLIGTLTGAVLAAVLGWVAARQLLRPLGRVGLAVGELARGNYDHQVPVPREAELASLVTDVNALGAELSATEARRLHLLGEVAHEMRTPLTVIDGYVEGMMDGVLPAEPEQLGQVSAEVRRLRRLSEDLSSLSRAEEGRLTITLGPVDLDAVAAGVIARLRSQAEDADLTLTAVPGAGTVPADADRAVQVLTNLVGNAIRATPFGGSITVTGSRAGASASLAVTDTGRGLAPADLERVFERFYRVPGPAAASEGSGIGLTVARAYMRAVGGTLTAASPGLGRGATFTATFG